MTKVETIITYEFKITLGDVETTLSEQQFKDLLKEVNKHIRFTNQQNIHNWTSTFKEHLQWEDYLKLIDLHKEPHKPIPGMYPSAWIKRQSLI